MGNYVNSPYNLKHRLPEMTDSPSTVNINNLPNELLIKIFSYLEKNHLILSVVLVCKRWYALGKGMQCWKSAIVNQTPGTDTNETIKYLKLHSGHLEKLTFLFLEDPLTLLKNINTSSIKSLTMYSCDGDLNIIEQIVNGELLFPSLEEICITFSKEVMEELSEKLQKLSLKKLGMISCKTVNLGDFKLFCLKNLVDVRFTHAHNTKLENVEEENGKLQEGLEIIKNTCKYLTITSPYLNDSTFKVISEMNQLKELSFSTGSHITLSSLDLLLNLQNLMCLVLYDNGCVFSGEDLILFFKKARFTKVLKSFSYNYTDDKLFSENSKTVIAKLCPKTKLCFNCKGIRLGTSYSRKKMNIIAILK